MAVAVGAWLPTPVAAQAGYAEVIEQIKPSIVAVGTFSPLRNPKFSFAGTGFAVADGLHIATNAHVIAKTLDSSKKEVFAVAIGTNADTVQIRQAKRAVSEDSVDLALLRLEGPPLPYLRLGDSTKVRDGDLFLFTGFPTGTVLGLFPVSHRAMVSAVTPIAIPALSADKLDLTTVRRLSALGRFLCCLPA